MFSTSSFMKLLLFLVTRNVPQLCALQLGWLPPDHELLHWLYHHMVSQVEEERHREPLLLRVHHHLVHLIAPHLMIWIAAKLIGLHNFLSFIHRHQIIIGIADIDPPE